MKNVIWPCCCPLLILLGVFPAFAQVPAPIVANRNNVAAGKMVGGTLDVHLEIRSGAWQAEAEDGPKLYIQAFGEAGQPSQIPGPMLRMAEGTQVHATVTNTLPTKATVHGLNTRPGKDDDVLEIPAGETRERTFLAGAAGTYYYWARTVEKSKDGFGSFPQPVFEDSALNGAFIVDPPGPVPPDRVFVVNILLVNPDVLQQGFEVVSINGKSYPYTEPLDYTVGDTVRWRVINPGFSEHPMHLHGAFYKVLSLGDAESDTQYQGADRQSVVTQDLRGGQTMLMEWSPENAGRWMFHCHFQYHMSSDERIPVIEHAVPSHYDPPSMAMAAHHDDSAKGMMGMNDMAGLVLQITVKPKAETPAIASASKPARKIDLIIEPDTQAAANEPKFSCSVREKNKVLASQDRSVGPPIFVTRGELTEISVLNHLKAATTVHWHGLEIESYYDGVMGGGIGDKITPAIAPGETFVARFTPSRAGTFIYHTHAADPNQLSGGIYGALIVLEPGQAFDEDHDKLLVIGTRDTFFDAKRITINGMEKPSPLTLTKGATYRLRLINMAPNLVATFRLGPEAHPAKWQALAKDGANVPTRLAKPGDAMLRIVSGETYDFQFQADQTGDIPMEVQNLVGNAKLVSALEVR
jgi:FtsP/CotA-like multicopper oxidase with cupredoxin domain